jgi:hypothetical protein
MFLLIKKLLICLSGKLQTSIYSSDFISNLFSSSQRRARPVPNGAKHSFDVNCYRWMAIHDNSKKTFSISDDDSEKPKEKGISQNSRNPSAKSEIGFPLP